MPRLRGGSAESLERAVELAARSLHAERELFRYRALRDDAVRDAVADGHSRASVAGACGLSRERVGQIVERRR